MHTTRRQALAALFAAPFVLGQGSRRKPNIVVILADDLGYGDLGYLGSPDVPTPHLDALARSGIQFTDGYVTAAVCSPSRAGLLTGRYQQRFGHEFNSGPAARDERERLGLPLDQTTLAQLLKQNGYRTGMVGKWHLGGNPEFHPMERGFEEYFGFLHGANQYATQRTVDAREVEVREEQGGGFPATRRNPVFRNRERVEEDEYLTDAFGREATAFINKHKQQPFFLYLAFNAVHTPLHTVQKYLDRFPRIKDERHQLLASMTSALDDNVGRVMKTLKDAGLEDNTLIFFLSDNGSPTYTRAGSNGALSGSKITFYEGGIRVPFLMRWPAQFRGGAKFSKAVSSLDILLTVLSAAGAKAPAAADGVDLVPFVKGAAKGDPHEYLFWRSGSNRAARKGKWKLIALEGKPPRLFDLSADIAEKSDVAAANPAVVKDLMSALDKWTAQLVNPKWTPRSTPTIPVNGEAIRWSV